MKNLQSKRPTKFPGPNGRAGSIPREVEDAVFRVWAKLVKVEEDEFGRSVLTLQRDIKVLREERVGMSPIVLSDFGSEE